MIGGLAYVIVLMGCSDDMRSCTQLARDKRSFETFTKCDQAQQSALLSDTATQIDFPTIASKCVILERRSTASIGQ